jgi:hypothetical protein
LRKHKVRSNSWYHGVKMHFNPNVFEIILAQEVGNGNKDFRGFLMMDCDKMAYLCEI